MCSVSGFDASDRVMDIAAQCGKPISSIAIGSAEGFLQAEKAINTSAKSGRWVLLKNVHLAPSWLVSLEKKLHSIQAHPGFRLFLTCEVTPKIPVNLLRAGRIFTFEPPPGIKASQDALSYIAIALILIVIQSCYMIWYVRKTLTFDSSRVPEPCRDFLPNARDAGGHIHGSM